MLPLIIKHRMTNNTNFVPGWESSSSLDPLSTYTSDDFFGFLDDNDDINGTVTNLLDIGIGRIPAQTAEQAKAYVDKLIDYSRTSKPRPLAQPANFYRRRPGR